MRESFMAIAFLAGFALVPQVGFNVALRNAFGHPVAAVVVNFAVGTLGLALFALATRVTWPARAAIAGAPAWAWLGGLLGGFYVLVATIVGPRLGAAALLALTVFGQLVASLLFDHFGWLGFPQQPISAMRLAGAACLLLGVVLVTR